MISFEIYTTNGSEYEIIAVEQHENGEVERREPHPWERQIASLSWYIASLEKHIATKAEGLVSRQA